MRREERVHAAVRKLVIALGPGFEAGKDAHFVVETNPVSPHLGRVISEGQAEDDTDIPTPVLGLTAERLIRAPADGILSLLKKIGEEWPRGLLHSLGSTPFFACKQIGSVEKLVAISVSRITLGCCPREQGIE